MKILISGDALYACKPVMDICKGNDWKYLVRFKEGAIPTLYNEFETIVKTDNESCIKDYEYITKLDYAGYKVNVARYIDTKKNTEFTYITDLSINNKNIENTIYVGRKRWKIENEGFNIQKNGTFDIGHLYSRNQIAIKVHYLLIQMAHIIRQLLEKGSIKLKELNIKIKEISLLIKTKLTSFYTTNLEVHKKIQLRFDG